MFDKKDSSSKGPGGLAIIVGEGSPSGDNPGASLPKEFLKAPLFDNLKDGSEGEITLKFKVVGKTDDSVDLDFTKVKSWYCDPATGKGGSSEDDSSDDYPEEDDMDDRFKEHSQERKNSENEYPE